MACNRLIIKQLREARGFTQADLAHAAGYSERLVVKAESGRSLSLRTIEDLADALSTQTHQIYPEDLVCEPVDMAMKFTAAVHSHQAEVVSAIRHFLDEEIVFHINGDPREIPFAGTHRGIEAVDRAFKLFFSLLEVPAGHDHTQDYRYLSQGTEVVIWGESWMHPVGCPLEKPMSISQLLRFRRGKLYHFEDHYDTQLAAEVLRPVVENSMEPKFLPTEESHS